MTDGDHQPWGTNLTTERVGAIEFRLYSPRPHSLGDLLSEARRWPDHVHLVQGDRRVTFGELEQSVRRGAAELRGRGIGVGDRVVLTGWNGCTWAIAFWSVVYSGATAVLGNPAWSASERTQLLASIDPALVLDGEGIGTFANAAAADGPTPDIEPAGRDEDPAVIVFTSGTASLPKGAVLTHRAIIAAQHHLLVMTGKLPHTLPADWRGDVQLQTIPLFHIGGFQQLVAAPLTASRMVFLPGRFEPEVTLALIERERIARWGAIPTMLSRVLDHPDAATRDLTSMKVIGLGGAPVSPQLVERMRAIFPNAGRRGGGQVYGMSEAGGLVTTGTGDRNRPKTSAGRAIPVAEIRIAGTEIEGEILVRSPAQMSGYFGDVEQPIDGEGWLHTGDLGRIDADGYLYVTGRSKDMIIRGGENIAPAQIETALLTHPAVLEAAAVGLPDPDLGEIVAAAVVVDPTADVTSQDLLDYLDGRLAKFAVPSRWWLRTEQLPTNAAGKHVKRDIVAAWPEPTGVR